MKLAKTKSTVTWMNDFTGSIKKMDLPIGTATIYSPQTDNRKLIAIVIIIILVIVVVAVIIWWIWSRMPLMPISGPPLQRIATPGTAGTPSQGTPAGVVISAGPGPTCKSKRDCNTRRDKSCESSEDESCSSKERSSNSSDDGSKSNDDESYDSSNTQTFHEDTSQSSQSTSCSKTKSSCSSTRKESSSSSQETFDERTFSKTKKSNDSKSRSTNESRTISDTSVSLSGDETVFAIHNTKGIQEETIHIEGQVDSMIVINNVLYVHTPKGVHSYKNEKWSCLVATRDNTKGVIISESLDTSHKTQILGLYQRKGLLGLVTRENSYLISSNKLIKDKEFSRGAIEYHSHLGSEAYIKKDGALYVDGESIKLPTIMSHLKTSSKVRCSDRIYSLTDTNSLIVVDDKPKEIDVDVIDFDTYSNRLAYITSDQLVLGKITKTLDYTPTGIAMGEKAIYISY